VNATLVLVQSDGSKREIPLAKPRTVIGRETSCQIRIPVSAVSRQHCEVVLEGEKIVIKDLGSSNGTFVNRRRVNQTELSAGDIVGVGPALFAVVVDGKPLNIDPQAVLRQASTSATGTAAVTTSAGSSAPGMAKKESLLDDLDDDDTELPAGGKEDSSMADFDFLDDDDEDDQPKL
jgi:pSer/pThr/pTyr-binding forkhead associated (FHA) protein